MESKFKYNPRAKYPIKGYKIKRLFNYELYRIVVNPDKYFDTRFLNVFQNMYLPRHFTPEQTESYKKRFTFWKTQLDFAVWCATTGCGVGFYPHIKAGGLTGSLFKFHFYYQTRAILQYLDVPLPQDTDSFNAYNNPFNEKNYEILCQAFGVPLYTDWRSPDHFTTYMLDESEGFTREGIVRINDSIRTYCQTILYAQTDTMIGIVGDTESFGAQKQFVVNVYSAINRPVDLVTQKRNFEKVIQYARSVLNYVFGWDLVLAPGDLLMRIKKITNYNNNIIIGREGTGLKLGLNENVNTETTIIPGEIKGTSTKNKSPTEFQVAKENKKPPKKIKPPEPPKKIKNPEADEHKEAEEHEDHKNTAAAEKEDHKNTEVAEKEAEEHEDHKNAILITFVVLNFLGLGIYDFFSRD